MGENSDVKVLNLFLQKRSFDMVQSGIQKEVYKPLKPYWFRRLFDEWFVSRHYDFVRLHKGFLPMSDEMIFEVKKIKMGMPKSEWTHKPDVVCYIVKLGDKVLESSGGGYA